MWWVYIFQSLWSQAFKKRQPSERRRWVKWMEKYVREAVEMILVLIFFSRWKLISASWLNIKGINPFKSYKYSKKSKFQVLPVWLCNKDFIGFLVFSSPAGFQQLAQIYSKTLFLCSTVLAPKLSFDHAAVGPQRFGAMWIQLWLNIRVALQWGWQDSDTTFSFSWCVWERLSNKTATVL